MEMEAVLLHYPWLKIALIAYLALILLSDVGLMVMVWRAFKNLRIATRSGRIRAKYGLGLA
jgi:hypothetical protein